jgi:hypothetical protein
VGFYSSPNRLGLRRKAEKSLDNLADLDIDSEGTDFGSFTRKLRAVKNAVPEVKDLLHLSTRRQAIKKPLLKLFDKENPVKKYVETRGIGKKNYVLKSKFMKTSNLKFPKDEDAREQSRNHSFLSNRKKRKPNVNINKSMRASSSNQKLKETRNKSK